MADDSSTFLVRVSLAQAILNAAYGHGTVTSTQVGAALGIRIPRRFTIIGGRAAKTDKWLGLCSYIYQHYRKVGLGQLGVRSRITAYGRIYYGRNAAFALIDPEPWRGHNPDDLAERKVVRDPVVVSAKKAAEEPETLTEDAAEDVTETAAPTVTPTVTPIMTPDTTAQNVARAVVHVIKSPLAAAMWMAWSEQTKAAISLVLRYDVRRLPQETITAASVIAAAYLREHAGKLPATP